MPVFAAMVLPASLMRCAAILPWLDFDAIDKSGSYGGRMRDMQPILKYTLPISTLGNTRCRFL